jgi:hypothetical protein
MQKLRIAIFGIRARARANSTWCLDRNRRFLGEFRRGAIRLSPVGTSCLRHTKSAVVAAARATQMSRTYQCVLETCNKIIYH